MAGGNLFYRALSFVLDTLVVEGLANNRAFQRFAVRTSKTIDKLSSQVAAQTKEKLAEQLRQMKDDQFKRH